MNLPICPTCDIPIRNYSRCACGYVVPVTKAEAVHAPPRDDVADRAPAAAPGMSYRERYYREHKLEYESAKLVSCPPFQCIGKITNA